MRQHGLSLLDLPVGSMAIVEGLNADPATRSRLYALGFIPGTEIEICAGCGDSGSRRIRVRDACLILGENMAEHISCTLAHGKGRLSSFFHHHSHGRRHGRPHDDCCSALKDLSLHRGHREPSGGDQEAAEALSASAGRK